MKTIVVIRHSKSSYFAEGHDDIDRPLNERGYQDAEMMREVLSDENLKIDKVISSPAIRAISTALMFVRGLKIDYKNIVINKRLYECGKQKILEVIKELDADINQVILVGHNPDFEELILSLVPETLVKFPTTGIAIISFNVVRWNDISHKNSKLIKLLLPEQYRED